jgi:hypothetical protein
MFELLYINQYYLLILYNLIFYQENYHHQYHHGVIGASTIHDLIESVDTAIEHENTIESLAIELRTLIRLTKVKPWHYKYLLKYVPIFGKYCLYHSVKDQTFGLMGFLSAHELIRRRQVFYIKCKIFAKK